MLAKKIEYVKSESVVVEPVDRIRGFGVAFDLAEAVAFAEAVLTARDELQSEYDEMYAECREADDIGRDESLSPWR